MMLTKAGKTAFGVVAVVLAFGCSDTLNPVAPAVESNLAPQSEALASRGAFGEAWQALGKRSWSTPTYTRATITPEGGTISSGDVTLTVPAGAVDSDVSVGLLVPGGKHKIALFFPHGLQFDEPATLSFSTDDAETFEASDLKGVYIGNGLARSDASYRAEELYDVTLPGSSIDFDISHFSGYIVASGRRADSGF